MSRSSVALRLLPPILLLLALPAAAAGADLLLHRAGWAPAGRWLGPVGAGLILVSFAHSLRRRRLLKSGSPASLLAIHEFLGWFGSFLLLVHGGLHVNAWIPWLAMVALVVVAASGLTGRHLLAGARRDLDAERERLAAGGLGAHEVERRLLVSALLVDSMKRWRSVHMPLTAILAALALVHVAATLVLW